MSRILCIETSSEKCSVALSVEGEIAASCIANDDFSHSRELTLLVDTCLRQSGISLEDLNAVAVCSGPGSFTGLRVGLSAAKGYCYGLGVPLIGVSALYLLAMSLRARVKPNDLLLPMVDARRSEVYVAIYDGHLEELERAHPLILGEDSFSSYRDGRTWHVAGSGAKKSIALLQYDSLMKSDAHLSASSMCDIAYQKFLDSSFENIASFIPQYIKEPNITTPKKNLLA